MKRRVLIALVVVLALAATASVVWAGGGGPSGPSGKSNVAHLYLHEKDESTWEIVPDGAWGKMKYNLKGPTFDFVFNGHGLDVGVDYSLIYYRDPWPGTPAKCLASGTANDEGNVHLANSIDLDMDLQDQPDVPDTNGAKIWLVLSGDVDCGVQMIGWNPTEYLFEYDGIFFDDTDA